MKNKLVLFLRNLTAAKILAVFFLAFSVYVGFAAVPALLINTGSALDKDSSLSEFIDVIDQQYQGMLTTVLDQPVLQNKGTYINFNGLMAKILDQPEMNERIKLKNGYLSSTGVSLSKENMNIVFENFRYLHEKQTEKGDDFLFILAPSKNIDSDKLFPTGYSDTCEQDVTYLLDLLDEAGIPYLDLRSELKKDGISYEDAFFVTDHHWKPQTGFWAYTKILNELKNNNAISSVNTFYTDPNNYEFKIYENSFLGSQGRRTGKFYAGTDDFCVILPKFDTNISIYIEGETNNTGRFEERAYYDLSFLDEKNYFNHAPYSIYGRGDRALTNWRNEHAPEAKNVMMIGDSFGNVPFTLMSLYFSSCDELDMRHYTDDFNAHLENYNPDILLFLVNLEGMMSNNANYPFAQE